VFIYQCAYLFILIFFLVRRNTAPATLSSPAASDALALGHSCVSDVCVCCRVVSEVELNAMNDNGSDSKL